MGSWSFGKERRLLKACDFMALRKGATPAFAPLFKAWRRRGPMAQTRVALSVSKKVGKAVVRNQIRRSLKEEFRLSPYREQGLDVLFVVSSKVKAIFERDKKFCPELRRRFKTFLPKVFSRP